MSVNEKMTAIANAIRAKTGKTGSLTLDQMASDIASIEAGSENNTETCTVTIAPATTAIHIICYEKVSNGAVTYAMTKRNTSSNINITARCGSVMYILADYVKNASITGQSQMGRILAVNSSYGVAYKTPDSSTGTRTITLKSS